MSSFDITQFLQSITLKDETWMPFGNDSHKYMVSSFGRVVSCPHESVGCIRGIIPAKLLHPSKDRYGSLAIEINNKGYKVHYLVATLFLPNPNNYPHVKHIDGNKSNNCITNLKWVDSISSNPAVNSIPNFSFSLNDLPNEEWRDISETNGRYKISSFGRVKSLLNNPKILSPRVNADGYVIVALVVNNKRIDTTVHRLVAKEFLGCYSGKEIDHIDGNRANNNIDNLQWVSHTDNMNNPLTKVQLTHRKSPMKGRRGKDHPLSKAIYAVKETGERLEFEGCRDACRKGYKYNKIQYCLHHPSSTYLGYSWFFLD